MKKQISIFNPYTLFILAVFVEYFPSYYNDPKPIINLGSIHLFVADIAFAFLLIYAFLKFLSGQIRSSSKSTNTGRGVQIIFALFFAYSCFKFLLQSNFDTGSLRMMLSYTLAYLFLFFFSLHITRKEEIRKLFLFLILFLIYIFSLHIYAFSTEGYKVHILGGEFLSMLGILYFLAIRENALLKLSATQSLFVKALVITTYFMVGHRSGLIALLLGLIVYSFYYKKSAAKEMVLLLTIVFVGAVAATIVSPKILSNLGERASTTFDSSQDTYQGRFNNIFTVLELSRDNPLIGKPLVTNETRQMKAMSVTRGSMTTTSIELVVTPHNLFLEWLLYYGWIGVLLGVFLIISAFRFVKRFLREHKGNIQCHQMGVIILCTMAHNLFFAFSNVTTNNIFSTYFLYFPLAILIVIGRNEDGFCSAS